MDSHLTSSRLALLRRFIIHDPLLNREYFPSAVPFFWSRKRASPFYARALFFMPYVEHSLHPYHPRRHCLVHSPSSSSSFFSNLPSLPLPYFFPFFLSSLNFKRTVTVPQEIVILIFLIFSPTYYTFIDYPLIECLYRLR